SHDMSAVRRLCKHAILLEGGRVVASGLTEDVVPRYLGDDTAVLLPSVHRDITTAPRSCTNGDARFTGLTYHGAAEGARPVPGGPLTIELEVRGNVAQTVDSLAIWLSDRSGLRLIEADTIALGENLVLKEGTNRFALRIDQLHLNPGTYVLSLWLAKRPATVIDVVEHAAEVEVLEPRQENRSTAAGQGVVSCRFSLVKP